MPWHDTNIIAICHTRRARAQPTIGLFFSPTYRVTIGYFFCPTYRVTIGLFFSPTYRVVRVLDFICELILYQAIWILCVSQSFCNFLKAARLAQKNLLIPDSQATVRIREQSHSQLILERPPRAHGKHQIRRTR